MLRMQKKEICWNSCSDAGDYRAENEDAIFAASSRWRGHRVALFAVADGCGGMQNGAAASAIAIDNVSCFWLHSIPLLACKWLRQTIAVEDALERMMQCAHTQVCSLSKSEKVHPASTLTVLLILDDCFWIRHVGDSRAYRLSESQYKLERLTEDQSMVEDMLRNREIEPWEASDYSRSILSMCLGISNSLHTYSNKGRMRKGDVFLLCSDGFHAYVDEENISHLLRWNPSDVAALRELIPAGQAGDNVSLITAWEE